MSEATCIKVAEGLIKDGIEAIAAHIEKAVACPVMLADSIGQLRFPFYDKQVHPLGDVPRIAPDQLFAVIFPSLQDSEYNYNPETRYFCYAVKSGEAAGYVIIDQLPEAKLAAALLAINDAGLALRCYFHYYHKANLHDRAFEQDLLNYFFCEGSANLSSIIKFYGMEIDSTREYFVCVSHIKIVPAGGISYEWIRTYSLEFFRRLHKDAIVILNGDELIFILPRPNREASFEPDYNWSPLNLIHKLNQVLWEKHQVKLNTGIGNICHTKEFNNAYFQARVALSIILLTGRGDGIDQFSQLGIFTVLFSQPLESCRHYCLTSLGKLIEYDQNHDSQLVETLKVLVDNGFNRKAASEQLYVHVNTLQYRLSKIEQLLNISFSKYEDCVNIYSVIMVYYTLKHNLWI